MTSMDGAADGQRDDAEDAQASGDSEGLDPNDPLAGQELELTFPCPWTYTVILDKDQSVELVIEPIVGAHEHTCSFSHESSKGSYCSYQLEVIVPTDEVRLRIFRELRAATTVRYVF